LWLAQASKSNASKQNRLGASPAFGDFAQNVIVSDFPQAAFFFSLWVCPSL
jgi:hypothetical protein